MAEITPIEAKIIKQVEYYFGDLNLSRDKFMKTTISENNGWFPMNVMLKFNRLKSLSDDEEVIKAALLKSTSGLLEIGAEGIRRCSSNEAPQSVEEAFSACADRSVYVKGFGMDSNLDDIINWLEEHGGPTLNVHMRRFPKDKKFKGSVFAVFDKRESAERFLNNPDAELYNKNTMIRKWQNDYWQEKKSEREASVKARAEKHAAAEAHREAQLNSRIVLGALLELTGLPPSKASKAAAAEKASVAENATESEESINGHKVSQDDVETKEKDKDKDAKHESVDELPVERTVVALKTWLAEKLGTLFPIAWVDVEPDKGKAVVRFKSEGTASKAWDKLIEVFKDSSVLYSGYKLEGRVLSDEEEKERWRTIVSSQQQKRQRRGRPLSKPSSAKRPRK